MSTQTMRAILRWGGPSTDDVETRRFQQGRVALTAKMMALFFGAISTVAAVVMALVSREQFAAVHLHPVKLISYGVLVFWAGTWLALRRRDRPLWVIHLGDLAIVFPLSVALGLAMLYVPPTTDVHVAGVLVGLLVLALRAALVPSRPAWTAVVGLLCGPPVLVGCYLRAHRVPTPVAPLVLNVAQAIWWTAMTALTIYISRIIYGLVAEVSRARRLGQYTLQEQIGTGGMGEVYRAQHALLRRPTAIKLVLPSRAGPETLRRFEREVQLTSRLSHPNTIAIYDYGRTPDGVFYYAMELLDGLSLEMLVSRDGPQPPARVVHILCQVTEALAEAHGIGLIHRDIKPANVMLCERGGIPDVAKVLDFGLVKEMTPAADDPKLTAAASITGTPLYMSPEAITGAELDGRADLYALGAVAYSLLAGRPPFLARTVVEICGMHLHTAPDPPSSHLGRPLPASLEALVLRCLAKDPAQRPPRAEDLLAELLACQAELPWDRARARAWWRQRPAAQ
jgi:eukaryotic-like serine/threonine-protein kinase